MTLRIEARLKSGVILIAYYDADLNRAVVTEIKGIDPAISVVKQTIVERALEHGNLIIEEGTVPDESAIEQVYPFLHIRANNLNGLKSGHGMALGLSKSFDGEPVWKDTVKSLTIGVGPYMA